MDSIDLYGDFTEEADEQANYFEENDPDGNQEAADENDKGSDKETVDSKLKVVKIKRKVPTLNAERLKGPRGIIAIDDFFKDIKFKGKGHEKQDLDEVMKRLEHWAHRMFPKYNLDDSLAAIERLGKKKEIAVHMTRYRLDQLTNDDERIVSDDEGQEGNQNERAQPNEDVPMDEFEAMIDEQIALSTVQSRTNVTMNDKTFDDISGISAVSSSTKKEHLNERVTESSEQISQPSLFIQISQQPVSTQLEITDEIRARIAENKRKALAVREQRRKEEEEMIKKKQLEDKLRTQEISSINIDDDDF